LQFDIGFKIGNQ